MPPYPYYPSNKEVLIHKYSTKLIFPLLWPIDGVSQTLHILVSVPWGARWLWVSASLAMKGKPSWAKECCQVQPGIQPSDLTLFSEIALTSTSKILLDDAWMWQRKWHQPVTAHSRQHLWDHSALMWEALLLGFKWWFYGQTTGLAQFSVLLKSRLNIPAFFPFQKGIGRNSSSLTSLTDLVKGQVGWGSGQTGLVEDSPVPGRGNFTAFPPSLPCSWEPGGYSFEVPPSDERIEGNSSKGQADMWSLGDFTAVWNVLSCNFLFLSIFFFFWYVGYSLRTLFTITPRGEKWGDKCLIS